MNRARKAKLSRWTSFYGATRGSSKQRSLRERFITAIGWLAQLFVWYLQEKIWFRILLPLWNTSAYQTAIVFLISRCASGTASRHLWKWFLRLAGRRAL